MKFSEKWLREWVNPDLDTAALVEQLSTSGLEVDTVEPVAGDLSGVVVGAVLEASAHPDADRLKLCRVDFGGDAPVDVVCGAPNARAGARYPFAAVGAKLPGGLKIRRSKIRGVTSNGMLCSARELGLGDEHDGILELPADAPVGADFSAYLGLDDHVIDIDLTPNRGDCLGLAGVAREVGVLNRVDVTPPAIEPVPARIDDTFPVALDAPDGCPRYIGRVIRNIDPEAATPLWMVERLRRSGIRAISPLVDVTNYVMLELGQPMHAFDLDQLQGGIRVRMATPGEQLELLDGRVIDLTPDIMVIADHQRPVALAGIMGGEGSGIADTTRHLFLECAYFAPLKLAGVARRFGLHTDASHRYERGVDPELQRLATERATALLLDIVGGEPGPLHEAVEPAQLPVRSAIGLRESRIERMLGIAVDPQTVNDVLTRLGMHVERVEGGWQVLPPSYRFDMAIEADLIEEVARVVGYDAMPSRSPNATAESRPLSEARLAVADMRERLIARGYQEAITFSFVDAALQTEIDPGQPALALANPISSDLAVMRTSLWPGLLGAVLHNLNRQHERIRLVETGLRFRIIDGELDQQRVIAGAVTGPALPEQWGTPTRDADFFDVKGDLQALIALGGRGDAFAFVAGEHPGLHPGQTAHIVSEGQTVGVLGALHPRIAARHKLPKPLYLFELRLEPLERAAVAQFSALSRFPAVRRDLSVLVDEACAAAQVSACVEAHAGGMLKNLELFDVYRGEGIDSGRKSLSFSLTFQDGSRTLNDDEIDTAVAAIVAGLKAQLGVVLRG